MSIDIHIPSMLPDLTRPPSWHPVFLVIHLEADNNLCSSALLSQTLTLVGVYVRDRTTGLCPPLSMEIRTWKWLGLVFHEGSCIRSTHLQILETDTGRRMSGIETGFLPDYILFMHQSSTTLLHSWAIACPKIAHGSVSLLLQRINPSLSLSQKQPMPIFESRRTLKEFFYSKAKELPVKLGSGVLPSLCHQLQISGLLVNV